MIRRLSIRAQLLAMVSLAALPLLGLALYGVVESSAVALRHAETQTRQMAIATAADLQTVLRDTGGLLQRLALRPQVRVLDAARCDPVFQDLGGVLPGLENLGLRDLQGNLVCATRKDSAPANVVSAAPWFATALRSTGFLISDIYARPGTSHWSAIGSHPVFGSDGLVAGLLVVRMDLGAIQQQLLAGVPAGVVVAVFDSQGRYAMRTTDPARWVGTLATNPQRIQQRAAGQLPELELARGADGVDRVYAFATVGTSGWLVAAGVAQDQVFAQYHQQLLRNGLAAAAALALALWLALRISAHIARPIHHLQDVAARVAGGDSQARAQEDGPGDVQAVARQFNQMLDARDLALARERRHADIYAALLQTNQAIVHGQDPQQLYQEICDICVRFGRVKMAYVVLLEQGKPVVHAWAGPAQEFLREISLTIDLALPQGRGPVATAVHERRDYICNDFHADERTLPGRAAAARIGTQAMAALPFYRGGAVAGVLSLHVAEKDYFDAQLTALLHEMVADLSFALDNYDREQARAQAMEALRVSEQRIRNLFDQAADGIFIFDGRRHFVEVNAAGAAMLGYGREELIGLHVSEVLDPREHPRLLATADDVAAGLANPNEWLHRRKDGSRFPAEVSDRPLPGGQFLAITRDLSARRQAEQRIEYLATHDGVTGLPNHNLMMDRAAQAISHARRTGRQLALMYLDLDRFKVINDGYGHAFGDAVLNAVGQRLRSLVRDEDTVARQSGDEFLVLLTDLARYADAYVVAQKILDAFALPFTLQEREVHVGLSMGVSIFPDNGTDVDALVNNADVAMYRAKDMGRANYQFFTQDMSDATRQRVDIENHLRQAVAQNQLHLLYQPKVDLASGRILGCEALLRWEHPELGSVSPVRFIPIAEESGQIVPIGDWVLRVACLQNRAWREAGLAPVVVSVNLSARQFLHRDVTAWVAQTLQQTGLDAQGLELELTESLIASDVESVIATVEQLKALGVSLSIDDFGTGYSSLSYLKRFKVDTLKIDQSFVRNMLDAADEAGIVLAVIALARSLKLTVIAEGVETAAHCAFLRQHDCDQIQGYYFSRPVPPGEFARMLAEDRRLALDADPAGVGGHASHGV